MMSNRYRASSRRCSMLPHASRSRANTSRRQTTRSPPVMSNIQGMRGKMSKNCLWHACQALFAGLVLFSIGAAMSTLGFHADGVLNPESKNQSVARDYMYTDDSRTTVRFSKMSYTGPIVMGVGGFIIVATCVLTFEARDSAAKVGPASYQGHRNAGALYTGTYRARARSLDVRSVGSQTIIDAASGSGQPNHIFDKKALLETFKKLSRTIRTGASKDGEFHRSPSAPNLLAGDDVVQTAVPAARRASILPKTKTRAPPALKHLRQTMSVDYQCSPMFLAPSLSKDSMPGRPVRRLSNTATGGSQCLHPVPGTSKSGRGYLSAKTLGTSTASASFSDGGEEHQRSNVQLSEGPHCSRQSLGGHPPHRAPLFPAHSLNVQFQPASVELHLPTPASGQQGGLSSSTNSLRHLAPTGNSSRSSLHLISPQPSMRSEDNSSFDRCSVNSESSYVSCTTVKSPRPRLRTELSCRPALMRQSRVDHTEITCVPDSDDELVLKEEPETDV